jgi:hypothetical protein
MVDLTEFDNLADKQIKAGGVKMSFASVLAIIIKRLRKSLG